jgi:YD repeat-containing protein
VGRPVVTDRGWARLEEAFDDAGRSTRIALYDAEGGLSESGEEGWAIMEQTTEGSTRTTSYRDKQGDLKVSTDGYARMIEILDPRGLVVEQQFFGADGEPVALTEGEIGMTVSYDAAGRILETRLLGDPASFTTTCARSAYAYDARGNTTRFGCRDGEGAPVPKEDWSGASDMIGEYDGRDRVIRMWLEDSSGEQLVNIEGCLETRYDYDSEGEKTAICVPPPGGGEGGAAADDTP